MVGDPSKAFQRPLEVPRTRFETHWSRKIFQYLQLTSLLNPLALNGYTTVLLLSIYTKVCYCIEMSFVISKSLCIKASATWVNVYSLCKYGAFFYWNKRMMCFSSCKPSDLRWMNSSILCYLKECCTGFVFHGCACFLAVRLHLKVHQIWSVVLPWGCRYT